MKDSINLLAFLIIFMMLNCNGETEEKQSLEVFIKTNRLEYNSPVSINYTIKNKSNKPIVFFDRSFIYLKINNNSEEYRLFPYDLIWRNDWRECKNDYVTIKPNDSISHTYNYFAHLLSSVNIVSGDIIKLQYKVIRKNEDNFYYDFENEHIEATTKIPINAYIGTLNSNIINLKVP